jgi:hypothetical protein
MKSGLEIGPDEQLPQESRLLPWFSISFLASGAGAYGWLFVPRQW